MVMISNIILKTENSLTEISKTEYICPNKKIANTSLVKLLRLENRKDSMCLMEGV